MADCPADAAEARTRTASTRTTIREFIAGSSCIGGVRFGGTAQRLRWLAKIPDKGPAHAFRVAKSNAGRYALDRLGAALDGIAGGFEPQALDRFGGGNAGFRRKGS